MGLQSAFNVALDWEKGVTSGQMIGVGPGEEELVAENVSQKLHGRMEICGPQQARPTEPGL